ncbi:hypothetical protein EII34_01170 [Arachnia propionica]|uniref:BPP domain-containing protein n=1 Tax=Arachnia propionica TaxID=1750 RepID=A0A3P1TD73_9ACTN|nr:hypothetical protein [Arachnia propionica]RRD07125.1 hypothetical protein EII34_01170 [Arachnia propionica]
MIPAEGSLAPDTSGPGWLVAESTRLSRVLPDGSSVVVAPLPDLAGELELRALDRWACVAERFGLRAVLVDLDTGATRSYSREDHHCDVSSYSVALLHIDGRVVVALQTQWCRLDLFDAETGDLLTDREISRREDGSTENHVDFFHSRLLISPEHTRMVSNGWVWAPVDVLMVYRVQDFLMRWEPSGARFQGSGDNWDRPICFIGEDHLVVALDRVESAWCGRMPRDDEAECADNADPHHPFVLLNLEEPDEEGYLVVERFLGPDFLALDPQCAEVKGDLAHDATSGLMVATDASKGSIAFDLEGVVRHEWLDLSSDNGWRFFPERRCFARLTDALGVEERAFPSA